MQEQATYTRGGISYTQDEIEMINFINKLPDGQAKKNMKLCFKAGMGKPFPKEGEKTALTDKTLG